jgi:prophage antirepressor-like protein
MTIQEFTNIEFGELKTIKDDNGIIWFCAADICRALDIKDTNMALTKLESDERMTTKSFGSHSGARGGPQMYSYVTEPGLYRLIFRSYKPEAKRFQYWVFHEVLPKLRQGNINNGTLYAPAFIAPKQYIDRYNALQEQCDYYQQQNQQYQQQIQQYQNTIQTQQQYLNSVNDKVSYHDDVMNDDHIIMSSQIAKDYGMSPQLFHTILHGLHIIYPCNKDWIINVQYANCGYTKTQNKDGVRVITGWTEAGRQFIYSILDANNYKREN